jgi:hypothetical protein
MFQIFFGSAYEHNMLHVHLRWFGGDSLCSAIRLDHAPCAVAALWTLLCLARHGLGYFGSAKAAPSTCFDAAAWKLWQVKHPTPVRASLAESVNMQTVKHEFRPSDSCLRDEKVPAQIRTRRLKL